MDKSIVNQAELEAEYVNYDRQQAINNFKVACLLGFVLMPAGTILDHWVYPEAAADFLKLRLLSSVLITVFFGILLTPLGRKYYRVQGVMLFMIPASFIAWMIFLKEGAGSPYYAGLYLVLLMLAFVLHWTFRESLTASALVLAMYIGVCVAHALRNHEPIRDKIAGEFANNLYFLVLTGIIVATGSYFHSKSRFREFALRFELDKQYKQLQEAEAQLVQTEKLASLGRMSAGIIHEINNPLNYATTGLFTLKNKGKHLAPEQQQEYSDILKDVEDGIKRVKNIVSDLRSFTHHDDAAMEHVDVSEVVTSALRFLSHEWRNTVQLEQKLTEHQTIWSNKNKLIQIIVNLLQNSLDAVRRKQFENGEKPTVWVESKVENNQSILVIRDNGEGIAPENLDKIFDPFFTTRDVGEGMGLGLSITYRIVQEYDGRIEVKSERGKFTELRLEFPLKGESVKTESKAA